MSTRCSAPNTNDMKQSKSDDFAMQNPAVSTSSTSAKSKSDNNSVVVNGEISHSASDSGFSASLALSAPVPVLLPKSECFSECESENDVRFQMLDTSRLRGKDLQRKSSHHVGIYDRVDPEDSIRDMITDNDFYKFVLFKTHYDKYLHLSKKYEEARNIAYYLEEKYHEIKAERDDLAAARKELEKRLEGRDQELHDKEEELFLQLERVVRLEEDCEKLRAEKDKYAQMKDALEKEKHEALRRLKQQSREAEATRRGLERARQEVVRQVSAIAAEKDCLERENESLRQQLEGHHHHHYFPAPAQRAAAAVAAVPADGLEREMSELKLMARQSQSLNSQLKKGMKHLATCKRKKCHVCAYTRESFGEYAGRNDGKLFSCLQAPLHDWRTRRRGGQGASSTPSPYCSDEGELFEDDADAEVDAVRTAAARQSPGPSRASQASPLPSCRSEYSFRRAYSSTAPSSPSPSPSHSLAHPLHCLGAHISYIDEASCSSGDSGQGEDRCPGACHCLVGVGADQSMASSCSASATSTPHGQGQGAASTRAFSSDSGFSSELYESTLQRSSERSSDRSSSSRSAEPEQTSPFQRGGKWTASFRKLLTRVSSRKAGASSSAAAALASSSATATAN